MAGLGLGYSYEIPDERQRNRKRASLPILTFERNAAAQHGGQFLTDVESQPGAFIGAGRGTVDLHKRLEKFGLVLLADAQSGVGDADLSGRAATFSRFAKLQPHRALFRELDGIVGQVNENLSQGTAVGLDLDLMVWKYDFKVQVLALGQGPQGIADFIDHRLTTHRLHF